MKLLQTVLIAAASLSLATSLAGATGLPDLGGRKILAVTENAYTPLNFADPKTGEGIGWEYDAFNEIGKRLNLKVEWKQASWDAKTAVGVAAPALLDQVVEALRQVGPLPPGVHCERRLV